MIIISSLFICILAGFGNGSFAMPTKYMTNWNEENIWFPFAFFTFLILPCLTILLFIPHFFSIIGELPATPIWTAAAGGIIFGLGQIFFALAFKYIGIGLNFVINISMGTAGGALAPLLWHIDAIYSLYSLMQIIGVLIFIAAVIYSAQAGAERNKVETDITKNKTKSAVFIGVFFSFLAGLGSAVQGASYEFASEHIINNAVNSLHIDILSARLIPWVFIFGAGTIPYALFFLFKLIKKKSFEKYRTAQTKKYWFYIICMGILYWSPVILFTKATAIIGGARAPMIAWPIYMIFIVLTSIFWSFVSKEWKDAGPKALKKLFICIILFLIAVIIFANSTRLTPATFNKDQTSSKRIVQ